MNKQTDKVMLHCLRLLHYFFVVRGDWKASVEKFFGHNGIYT
ncbi:MAG: hypothetical protein VCA13_02500 [PS1 clade bacterium]